MTEMLRGIGTGQNAVAAHLASRDAPAGMQTSLAIGMRRPLTPAEMGKLNALAEPLGMAVNDTGAGVNLVDWQRTIGSKGLLGQIKGGLKHKIEKILPDAGKIERIAVSGGGFDEAGRTKGMYHSVFEGGYGPDGPLPPPVAGSGAVTDKWLGMVDEATKLAPKLEQHLSSDAVKAWADDLFRANESLSGATIGGVELGRARRDIQNFLMIYGEGGLKAIRAARKSGIPLPVIAGLAAGSVAAHNQVSNGPR